VSWRSRESDPQDDEGFVMAVDASGGAQGPTRNDAVPDGAVAAGGGQTLDVHAHAMPLPLLQRLADRGLAELDGVPDGIVRLDSRVSGVAPRAPLPLARSQYDVAVRLSEMDGAGVDRHAVSLPPFLFASTADDRRFVLDVVAPGNDELAVYVADAPERLLGLGSVPLGLPDAAEEARRCLDELGLAGIAIGSRGGGRDLDDPVNDDLWTLLAERGTFVFLHPSGVPDPKRVADWYMPQLVGYPAETAIAVARLVFSGTLDRFPLRLCLAHGGGCLPSLRGRMDMGWERKEVAHTTRLPPSAYVDRLFYDTAVFNTTLLTRLVEDVGAEHVMMGTDHPFELADFTPVETVRALGLDETATRAILWDNAACLLGLPVTAGTGTA
jgi:aminocarboxymuconate-semialdehyde decarboxylase